MKITKNKVKGKNISDKELKEWNKKINQKFPMEILDSHPNPIIRYQEKNRRKILLKLAATSKKRIVADIGCEEGYLVRELSKDSKIAYGVDIDDNLLKKAKKRGKKNTCWIQSNIHNIKLKNNTAHITICSCVLEHVPNLKKSMDELIRITKPNGRLVINVPNEKWVLFIKKFLNFTKLSFLLGKLSKEQAHGHIHIFNKKKLVQMCTRKDLIIKKIRYDFPFFTNVFVQLKVKKRK